MGRKILVIDDSHSTIELINSYIDDFDIIGASDGKAMWEALVTETPELILLDIIMPGVSGFELANQLSKDERYSNIPIIFISAKNTGRDVFEGLKLDVYDYIKKPFDKLELEARINATLKRKDLEKKLEERSLKDTLTDCFNRKYFYNRINQQINYYARTKTLFSVAMIDIDNFKNINDTRGHLAGDQVLIQFTEIIKKSIRNYDILARYGGEEFVILYNNCSKANAAASITNIKKAIESAPPVHENNKFPFTFSCGIVQADEIESGSKITFEALIKIADERLYRAKALLKNKTITD